MPFLLTLLHKVVHMQLYTMAQPHYFPFEIVALLKCSYVVTQNSRVTSTDVLRDKLINYLFIYLFTIYYIYIYTIICNYVFK